MWNGTILSSIHFRCRYGGFRNGSYNLFIVTFYIISYYLQKIILFIMGSQISSGNRFSTFRMEILNRPLLSFISIPYFSEESFEILPEYVADETALSMESRKNCFCVWNFSITGSDAIGNHTLIFRIKFFLPSAFAQYSFSVFYLSAGVSKST